MHIYIDTFPLCKQKYGMVYRIYVVIKRKINFNFNILSFWLYSNDFQPESCLHMISIKTKNWWVQIINKYNIMINVK